VGSVLLDIDDHVCVDLSSDGDRWQKPIARKRSHESMETLFEQCWCLDEVSVIGHDVSAYEIPSLSLQTRSTDDRMLTLCKRCMTLVRLHSTQRGQEAVPRDRYGGQREPNETEHTHARQERSRLAAVQYAPFRAKTAGSVRRMIDTSSQIDQFSR
jgi:hypothetical protein